MTLSDRLAVCTPRRSPRLVKNIYNIFLHKVEEGSGKIFSTAEVIHDLSKIMELLINIQNDAVLYVPRKNLFWLRKGSKQPVSLKTDQGLEMCKKEYGAGSIRIVCEVVYVSSSGMMNIVHEMPRFYYGSCLK